MVAPPVTAGLHTTASSNTFANCAFIASRFDRISNVHTGPNMAGKSTVLRSTAAVALLAAVGLHAPARSATVPYIDAFMLRNFSADSPLEGKSSFAVEMTEMRYVHTFGRGLSIEVVDALQPTRLLKASANSRQRCSACYSVAGVGVCISHCAVIAVPCEVSIAGVQWFSPGRAALTVHWCAALFSCKVHSSRRMPKQVACRLRKCLVACRTTKL